nr:MAG TPA: hypothetical protein [Bacteriophage sp.]
MYTTIVLAEMYSGDGLGLVEVARESSSNLADAIASANRVLPGDYITEGSQNIPGTTTEDYPSVELWVISDDEPDNDIYKRIIIGCHVYTCDYTDLDK